MNPSVDLPDWIWDLPGFHIPLPIEQVSEFPLLEQCLAVWKRARATGLPATLDPVDLPREAIKGVSLLEWSDEVQDWVVRLSSTLLDEKHGRSMRGTSLSDGFKASDLETVRAETAKIIQSGEPDLRRREFHDPNGRIWSYVRLILPLSSDGLKRDRYALIFDPETFGQRIGE